MRIALVLFFSVLLMCGSASVSALDNEHFASIKHLGQLNGVALHCQALEETQRMKRALVLNLPKRRQLGELFDSETHLSYMKFIQEQASCPSLDLLRSQVDEAIQVLEAVFKP